MIVVDASVAAKWFFADERDARADAVLDRLQAGESAHAPALFRWEIENMFLSAERSGRIDATEVEAALEMLRELPIRLEAPGDRFFTGTEVRLAQAYALTVYDAAYLAAAANLAADLATANALLAHAARDLGIRAALVD